MQRNIKQISIINCPCYLFIDMIIGMIDIKNVDPDY